MRLQKNNAINIRIADEVVAKVAAKATIEIDGVYKMSGGVVEEVSELFGKKTLGKGVKVEVGERECSIDVYLVVEYGAIFPEVASNVQQSIIKNIIKENVEFYTLQKEKN